MTNKEYREHEGISRSELFLFNKTPKHFEYAKSHPSEKTPALIFGSAAHKMILEKEDFFEEFAVTPYFNKRTKEGREAFDEFVRANSDKMIITKDEYVQLLEMEKAIDEHPLARKFLEGEHEQSFFWIDDATEEPCKCKPDSITTVSGREIDEKLADMKLIVDYKTTDSLEDGNFERSCKKYGYKLQTGMYREGVFQNTFEDYGFAFVCQEKKAPYAVRVYVCTEQYINEGYDQYRALMGLYHHCKKLGKYPSYEGFDNEFDYLMGDE